MSKINKLKLFSLLLIIGLAFVGFTNSTSFTRKISAFSDGPPPGHSGAPGESNCTVCHAPGATSKISLANEPFAITAPVNYTPGETYTVVVQHTSSDNSRQRWGFQLTSLNSSNTAAGTFANLSGNTQILTDSGRFYVEHTFSGTFSGQTGGAQWSFEWTAPATDVGPITFYAAGNQSNNDFTSDGDEIILTTSVSQPQVPKEPNLAPFDLDGDGKSDISIFRSGPNPAQYWLLRSSDGGNNAYSFGLGSDKPVPADYTGDGRTDLAFFRESSSEWFVLRSEDFTFYSFPFGANGDIPAPGDFDGDGKADTAVFRPSSSTWFILRSSDGGTDFIGFGTAEDKPTVADYDGDGMDDIAIYRPSVSQWWLNRSTDGVVVFQFGQAGDQTVQGDYTGDGKADVAFWRPASGEWFVIRSEDQSFFSFPFGSNGDLPSPGDYDGDGTFDATVFRPTSTTWFINRSSDSGTDIVGFGISTDVPLANSFVNE